MFILLLFALNCYLLAFPEAATGWGKCLRKARAGRGQFDWTWQVSGFLEAPGLARRYTCG